MAEVAGGLTTQQVMDIIAANASTSFVGGTATAPTTVANLIANFPPAANMMGQYARVSDLYGTVDDIMRCRFDGVAYRWIPQRPSFSGIAANTGGTVPIVPLVTPPTLRLSGTLLGNMSVVPSAVNAYVGQQQRVIMEGTLGLFAASITGLIGSNVSLLGGGSKLIEYSPTGWFAAG